MICLRMMKKFINLVFEDNSLDKKVFVDKNENDLAHSILGVPQNTSTKDIKKAYLSLMKEFHPDNYTTANTFVQNEMSEKTKLINWAYNELKKRVA